VNTETAACDVLVIGSGAAGMTTAITAQHFGCDVLVVEKSAEFGGTTARSGGWLWVPGNPLAKRSGVEDSLEKATTYIRHEAGNHFDAGRVAAFLQNAGAMVSFLEEHTEVKFTFGKNYPDYHPDHPGGVEEGRSIHPLPFDGCSLGADLARLAQPMRESTFMGMGLEQRPRSEAFPQRDAFAQIGGLRCVEDAGAWTRRPVAWTRDAPCERQRAGGAAAANGA
jgi:succinate dehydrogenase/fumarate reductase flavoprotein subunit